MNSTERGRRAEAAAAVYLEMRGYQIIERNWRRPRAEIDILAKKDGTMYFMEVKYRETDLQGGGLEAITATKLRQMQRAAELWVEEEKWQGPYQLGAIEIAGENYAVMSFIDNVF